MLFRSIPAVGDDVCDWVLEEGGGEFASEACAIAGTCPASEATITTMAPMANRITVLCFLETRSPLRFVKVI